MPYCVFYDIIYRGACFNMDLNSYSELEKIAKIWQTQLNLEYNALHKNIKLAFKDVGAFTEFLAIDFCSGYTGSGSGGMGLDLVNRQTHKAIEVKSCCIIQNAKCNKCGTKFNDMLIKQCPNCGSNDFSTPSDSRFGIDAAELLNQVNNGFFDRFIMCCISLKGHDEKKNQIDIKMDWFTIDFDDKTIRNEQLAYFQNQKSAGRKAHCNLLPFSYDFYKLCPKQICEAIVTINYADLNIKPVVAKSNRTFYLRVPISVMAGHEQADFRRLKSFNKISETADSKEFTMSIPYRRKSLGKKRGNTRTNVYKALGRKTN